jgi:hypothetical protein
MTEMGKATPVTSSGNLCVVRRRDSHIFYTFYTISTQLVVRMSTLRAGRPFTPGRFLVFTSVNRHTVVARIMSIENFNDRNHGLGQDTASIKGQDQNHNRNNHRLENLKTCDILRTGSSAVHFSPFKTMCFKRLTNLSNLFPIRFKYARLHEVPNLKNNPQANSVLNPWSALP